MYKTSWNWNAIKHTSYTANAVMWGKYNRVLYETLWFAKKSKKQKNPKTGGGNQLDEA